MRTGAKWLLALGVAITLPACPGPDEPRLAEGVFADLGEPLPSATEEQLATFARGRAVALRRFDRETGLGPEFNLTFCGGCHEKPTQGGSAGRYRDFLLQGQRLPDGSFTPTGASGVQRQFSLGPEARVPTPEGTNVVALRNPIPFFGVGLLAELPEEVILERADPDDRDGDGISGRPNFDRGFVGRFGRKSQTVSLEGFIRGPLFNHLGVTSNPLTAELQARLPVPSVADVRESRAALRDPDVGRNQMAQAAAPAEPTVDDDGVPDPELGENDLFDLVAFAMLLAAPQPDEPNEQARAGRIAFDEAGCEDCHRATLAGPRGLIPAFTDLLLHDMGPELADGIQMGVATGSEFRTQPLWGIVAVGPYLHDGRADTLDEAIRMHAGEAAASRDRYIAFPDADRDALLAFLDSLGGSSQRTDGLLPPGAPVPAPLAFGGPREALSASDAQTFERGRAVFDRDVAITGGLGPFFNGDACRACHFDPVIGGAGPSDVDVTRHGTVDSSGGFVTPEQGTMAHHQAVGAARPPVDPDANVFEHRQTPPLFGLGLLDSISDATILSNEDPDDLDGNGVSGRAHVLPDGRVGRLGWKANVPSVAEFARDALFNEVGVTLPSEAGQTFGALSDSDDTPDPEISHDDLVALVFFMSMLAPPPRSSSQPTMETAGEEVFARVGCGDCHRQLDLPDGTPVALFSDLLLHDVAAPGAPGIADGDASPREFRTSPLWGISASAPYMHDGAALTIEEAVVLHDAEGAASRDATMMLSAADRAALIAFLESL